jgi:hypothetical protein
MARSLQNDGCIVWFHGIPGAGKTFLSAMAIDYTKKLKHRTLFSFVSHLNKASLTALSVIQSLIFQAADDDNDFQVLLVESKERELQGNLRHATELLQLSSRHQPDLHI